MLGGAPLASLTRRQRALRLGYLPQGHVFHWPLSVADVVGLGRLPRGAGADLSEEDRERRRPRDGGDGHLGFAERAVTTLSGGERARVALARVLATEADLILADEPTASLDPRYQLVVLDILKRHAANGAVIAVLHDLGLAARYADRLLILDEGGSSRQDRRAKCWTKPGSPRPSACAPKSSKGTAQRSSFRDRSSERPRAVGGRRSHELSVENWRPRPESNRGARICSPLRNHSATRPTGRAGIVKLGRCKRQPRIRHASAHARWIAVLSPAVGAGRNGLASPSS